MNSYIEELSESQIVLHLRSAQKHLDKPSAHKALEEALSELYGRTVELKIVHDDNSEVKTPLEWRQAIYEENWHKRASLLLRIKRFKTALNV